MLILLEECILCSYVEYPYTLMSEIVQKTDATFWLKRKVGKVGVGNRDIATRHCEVSCVSSLACCEWACWRFVSVLESQRAILEDQWRSQNTADAR